MFSSVKFYLSILAGIGRGEGSEKENKPYFSLLYFHHNTINTSNFTTEGS